MSVRKKRAVGAARTSRDVQVTASGAAAACNIYCAGVLVAALRLRLPAWAVSPVRTVAAHSYAVYLVHLPILASAASLVG